MPPISSARPENRLAPATQVDPGNEDNFSNYLEQKVQSGSQDGSDLLGVKNHELSPKAKKEPAGKTDKIDNTAMSAAVFLQQLLADLRNLAKKPGSGAGQWSFQLKSMAMLNKMAEQVGMKPAELAPLKEQMAQNGTVSLADIFSIFAKHLQTMQEPPKITAPETDLPLLESMLSRMGVDTDKLAELSAKSIDNQGKFDLSAYLQGLKTISASRLKTIKVSGADLAQIKDMLAAAGVGKDGMANIFPKTIAAFKRDLAGLPPLADKTKESMGLAHLKEILAQGLADVRAQRPKVNLPAFLRDLSDLLGQTGFVKHGAGWMPVVQASLISAYQDLQKMIDLARVKVGKDSDITRLKQDWAEEWQNSGKKDLVAPLAAAGVGKDGMVNIFPKTIAAFKRDIAGLPPLADKTKESMALAHLKEILAQGLANVKAQRPKVGKGSGITRLKQDWAEEWQNSGKKDLAAPRAAAGIRKDGMVNIFSETIAAFKRDLSDILGQTGLVKHGAGWTPVVQASLISAYQDLQKMIDLARVKVGKGSGITRLKQDWAEEWQNFGKKGLPAPLAVAVNKRGATESAIKVAEAEAKNLFSATHHKDFLKDAENSLIANIDSGQAGRPAPLRPPPVMKLSAAQILQQFAMDQISQGVTRGLADDEHHLTLTMYPKELGEVKVDMQIRNNHLAVSFVMDNHRVKEALEKNMEEFKDNLSRQGYSLEACAVMVDQRKNDSGGARQQFESAWEQLSLNGAANRPGAAGPGESLRQIALLHSVRWPESSISVFA